jgi:hypothetical protein
MKLPKRLRTGFKRLKKWIKPVVDHAKRKLDNWKRERKAAKDAAQKAREKHRAKERQKQQQRRQKPSSNPFNPNNRPPLRDGRAKLKQPRNSPSSSGGEGVRIPSNSGKSSTNVKSHSRSRNGKQENVKSHTRKLNPDKVARDLGYRPRRNPDGSVSIGSGKNKKTLKNQKAYEREIRKRLKEQRDKWRNQA